MSKSVKLLGTLIVLALGMSISFVEAKDSIELNNEANKLESHAINKESAADTEQKESSLAIDEGKKGSAAVHAKRAAKQQKVANDLEDKAADVKAKAYKKAVKESH